MQIQLRTHVENCFYHVACIAHNEMCARNRILCPAIERERGGGEELLSGFENYSIALVSPQDGSLHTQVGKKSHSPAHGVSALI